MKEPVRKVGTLKILGHFVEVYEDDNLINDRSAYGEWIYRKLYIAIDGSTVRPVQQEKLWHEIIEAINEMDELNLNHHQIQSLATALYQITNDNDIYLFLKRVTV